MTPVPAETVSKPKMVVAFLHINPKTKRALVLRCYTSDRMSPLHEWDVPHGLVKESDLD